MTHIKITQGLDIPIKGKPRGQVQKLFNQAEGTNLQRPEKIALNLSPFDGIRFKLLAKEGDHVKIGDPLVEDRQTPGRVFVSPAAGAIIEVRRGLKRKLLDMVIKVDDSENYKKFEKINPATATREALIEKLLEGGLFAYIRTRPFDLLADPKKVPRAIFIKALESAPFVPPAELQVEGNEKEFQTGLDALAKLTDGNCHLICRADSTCVAFKNAKQVTIHTAEGPHPISNASLHIERIEPIQSVEDCIWTLTALDVVAIGYFLTTGTVYIDRIISIAGPAILPERTGYFRLRSGFPIAPLIAGRIPEGSIRFVSGDPLMGQQVKSTDFLGFYDTAFCAIPDPQYREFLHFFRLGANKYSSSRAYFSGHKKNGRLYDFTTSQHGEKRAFIDPDLYDRVMPLKVPTMQLVKAVMAEDYDLAEQLGLLDVVPEDFALPTFVCPSKVEMTEIIRNGLSSHASEVVG